MRGKLLKVFYAYEWETGPDLIDSILALLKQEGCIFPNDPIPDLEVERECPDGNCGWFNTGGNVYHACTPCYKDGKLTSSLTVGELMKMAGRLIEEIDRFRNVSSIWDKALTLPDGGRVRKVKEG
jgi:hypothetical protein